MPIAPNQAGQPVATTLPEIEAGPVPAVALAIADLRRDYCRAHLDDDAILADPLAQFSAWFEQARAAAVPEPNAMSLATADASGRPSSRIVLLKQFDANGFVWFTNYHSRKGLDLQQNPYAALLFHWVELERQVRIEGTVERLDAAASDAYFDSRPLASRLGAIASEQSAPIANRTLLEQRFALAEQQSGQPRRPSHWGGFRLQAQRIEFWQGRRSRLHDRIVYIRAVDGGWRHQRLQP